MIEDVITSVTESDDIPSSAEGFTIVEGEDLTLLPGLIDSHVHVNMPSAECFKVLEPALSNGVTTICDMHNNPGLIQKLKEMCSKSNSLPDLKSACYAATIQGGWPKPIVLKVYDSPEVSRTYSSRPSR